MSEEENSQTAEGRDNPMAAPNFVMTEEVRVMLVDNDKTFVTETADLLKSYNYKVTTVGTASAAMSMLFKGKKKIDVMIINVDSSNLLSFKLLAQAVDLNIISLFVCDEHNQVLANKALDEGAFLYLKKPFDEEILKYLWKFVWRKKSQREKATEGFEKNRDRMNVVIGNSDIVGDNEEQLEEKKNVSDIEEQHNNMHESENDVVSNTKYEPRRKRGRKSTKQINERESESIAINKVVRKKAVIEWTVDLHAKFMEAVQQLGEGRCYPKEILEVINVPGLTRTQVASHLQKCRRNNWRAPEKRKHIRHPSRQGLSSGAQQKSSFRKFGTMPRLQTDVSNMQRNPDQTQRGEEFPFPTLNTDGIFSRGESSIQQLHHPQLQVQPHYFSIDNPSNNQFFFAQNNAGRGLQQKYGIIFEMLGSQGLHESIIENTNYRPSLTLDSGDHHTQSHYNLDLDAAHGTTHSGSGTMFGIDNGNATVNDYNMTANVDNMATFSGTTVMSDTYIENMIINEFGAPDANFQQYIGELNMSDPSNIIVASYESDIVRSDSNEKKNCDAYLDLNNINNLFQNLDPPSANLPNEQGSEFNQVFSDDQVATTSSVQFPGIANYSDESSI